LERKKEQIGKILQLNKDDPSVLHLERSLNSYLQISASTFDLSQIEEEVLQQILATLYDYPRLKECEGIVKYVKECVRVAWGLVNQVNDSLFRVIIQ